MKPIEKLSEAISESTDSRVIAEIFYERNCPQVHKDVLEALIKRFLSEMRIVERFFEENDNINNESNDVQCLIKSFNDWLNLDQVSFLRGIKK